MTIQIVYRDFDGKISRKLTFTGFSTLDNRPQGRMENSKGVSLGVRAFNDLEVQAWEARTDGQVLIEMGRHRPYKSVLENGLSRAPAPSGISGRGDTHYSFVGNLMKRIQVRCSQQTRYDGLCY